MTDRILEVINFDNKGEVESVKFYGDAQVYKVKNFKQLYQHPKIFNAGDKLVDVNPIVILKFESGGYEMMCVKLKNCSYAC